MWRLAHSFLGRSARSAVQLRATLGARPAACKRTEARAWRAGQGRLQLHRLPRHTADTDIYSIDMDTFSAGTADTDISTCTPSTRTSALAPPERPLRHRRATRSSTLLQYSIWSFTTIVHLRGSDRSYKVVSFKLTRVSIEELANRVAVTDLRPTPGALRHRSSTGGFVPIGLPVD